MSYIYLQEQEGGSLVECSSDTPQFALWKLNLIAEKSFSNGSEMASSQDSPFGTMFAPSTESPGEDGSMSFAGDSLAKIFPPQERGPESRASEAASGKSSPESLKKSSQLFVLSKTPLFSEQEDWRSCWKTLPRWGTMQHGELSERTMPGHLTAGTGSGFLATPTAAANQSPKHRAVHRFPTPNASDHIQRKTSASWKAKGRINFVLSNPEVTGVTGGQLNPPWVEWLMNWPVGWTSLEALNVHEFQYWKATSAANGEDSLLRELWFNREAGAPPQGTPPYPDSLVPCLQEGVQTQVQKGETLRQFRMKQDLRETLRRTEGVKNRVDRLKAIGNGQVPRVAVLAWSVLTTALDKIKEMK